MIVNLFFFCVFENSYEIRDKIHCIQNRLNILDREHFNILVMLYKFENI